MIDEQTMQTARERLAVLHRAQDYRELVGTRGWQRIQELQQRWLLKHIVDMKKPQGDTAALEALRRWQIAEGLVDLQLAEIDETIKQADEIRGTISLEEALFMEHARNEQQSTSGDPGFDSTGH